MLRGSAIVVTYNSRVWIERCLEALISQPGWEVILIDNASQDDTVARASKFASQVRIVANTENKGFSGGVNQGVKLASTDILALVNPDAIAAPGALDKLADAIVNCNAGAAGGLLLEKGRPQVGNMRRFPTLPVFMAELLLLNSLWYRNPWNRSYRYIDLDYARPQPVEQPAGANLAFRRAAWESVGGFDERFYPAWFEDGDFCYCLHKAGWTTMYEPAAVFDHEGNSCGRQLPFYNHKLLWHQNLLRYFRKHHGRLTCAVLRAGITTGSLLRAFLSLFSPPEGKRAPVSRREAISAYVRLAWNVGIWPAKAPHDSPTPLAEPPEIGGVRGSTAA